MELIAQDVTQVAAVQNEAVECSAEAVRELACMELSLVGGGAVAVSFL